MLLCRMAVAWRAIKATALVLLLSLLLLTPPREGAAAASSDVCGPRCRAEQRAALVQLYNRLDGPNWSPQGGWATEGVDHCSWRGVYCCLNGTSITEAFDANTTLVYAIACRTRGAVIGLQLNKRGLRGTLDAALQAAALAPLAPHLLELYLRDNALTGDVGLLLRGAEGLRELAVSNNRLSGTLPAYLGSMRDLQSFTATHNHITGSVPRELTLCRNLSVFIVSNNRLTGALPPDIFIMPLLEVLQLDNNLIEAIPTPSWVGVITPPPAMDVNPRLNSQGFWSTVALNITPLGELSLRNNSLRAAVPPWLFALPVFTIDLSHNSRLVGTLPTWLGHNPWIRELNLDDCAVAGRVADSFDSPNLNLLTVRRNRLSGPLPPSLGRYARISVLALSGNALTGTLPASYHNLAGATVVAFENNNLTVNAGLPPWLAFNHDGRTLVSRDSDGDADVLCDPLIVRASPNTLFTLDASYYGWQGCRCQDPNAHELRVGEGLAREVHCVVADKPASQQLQPWAIAVIVLAIVGSCAALLLAGWLAWRWGLVHVFAQWRANAAKRKPPGQGEPGGKEAVTLVLTDVEGSTELWEWDADVTSAAIALHDRLLRSFIPRFYGYEVTTEGDAFLVAFHDAFDAAAWCLTVQLALMCIDWPEALLQHKAAAPSGWDAARGPGASGLLFRGLRVRMAVATGRAEAVRTHAVTKRLEYKGAVLKRVQALADAAHGGQILLGPLALTAISGRMIELGAAALQALQLLPRTSAAVDAAVDAAVGGGRADGGGAGAAMEPDQSLSMPRRRAPAVVKTSSGGGSGIDAELGGGGGGVMRTIAGEAASASARAAEAGNRTAASPLHKSSRTPSASSGGGGGRQQHSLRRLRGWWRRSAFAAGARGNAPRPTRWSSVAAIDEGTHELAGLAEPMSVVQLQPCGLEERARMLPSIASRRQLTPGYFDAPAARLAPLGARAPAVALPEVVIMFCAIDGFNAMLEYDADAARRALEMYTAAIRWLLLIMGGYECAEDDSTFMVAFADADAAVELCLMVQQVLQDVSWPDAVLELPGAEQLCDQHGNVVFRGPRVRMGLYRGAPTRVVPHNTGRADYFGPLVNRAARFCHAAAYGGQVLVPRELLLGVVQSWLGAADAADGAGDDSRRVVVLPAAGEPPAQLVARFDSALPRSWPWPCARPDAVMTATLSGALSAATSSSSFLAVQPLQRDATASGDAPPPPPSSSSMPAPSRKPSRPPLRISKASSLLKAASSVLEASLPSTLRAHSTHVPAAEVAALFAGDKKKASGMCTAVTPRRWLWARELLVHDVGTFAFKGVSGEHAVLSVTAEQLAGRAFPTAHRGGKGRQVAPGRGRVLGVRLQAA